MADKTTVTNELKIVNLFTDGDTRTITLKNPRNNITTSDILALENLLMNGGGSTSLIIGDKYGSDFRRIQEVSKIEKTTVEYDISQ